MLNHDYPGQRCSIAASLEVVGERWSLLIVRDVLMGTRRFDRIQQSLGIARNVLTRRLTRLVDAGILEKRRYQDSPVRYEYFLTPKGLDLWPALMALLEWGDRYCEPDGPPMLILHKGCGGEIDSRRICRKCGARLTVHDAQAVPA